MLAEKIRCLVMILTTCLCWLPLLPVQATGEADIAVLEERYRQTAAQQGEDAINTAYAMWALGNAYLQQAKYKEAVVLYEKVLPICRLYHGESHPYTISSMANLASACHALGRNAEALALYEKSLSLRLEALGEKNLTTLESMNDLALIYRELGRYAEAFSLTERVLRLRTERLGENHRLTLESVNNLAVICRDLGRNEEALALHAKALRYRTELFGEKNPAVVQTMNNLALTYRDLGRYEEALELGKKALQLRRELLGEKNVATVQSMNNVAISYDDIGKYSEALALNEKALQLRLEIMGPNHPNTIQNMNNVANNYQHLHRDGDAVKVYEQAVAGVEFLRQAGGLSAENRQAFFAMFIDMYKCLSNLYVGEKRTADAFRMAELSKARTLLESSAARLANQSGVLLPEEGDKLRAYDAECSRLDELISKSFDRPEQKIAIETEKNQLLSQYNAYRAALMAKYPKYAQLNEVKIVSAAEGCELIPADAVLVSYLVRSFAEKNWVTVFLLRADGSLKAFLLGDIPFLDETLAAYVKALQDKKAWLMPDGSYRPGSRQPAGALRLAGQDEIGAYLGGKLLGPLQSELRGQRHWIVSGDGALSMIPFEALLLDGQQVIDEHDISYIQSLSMLRLLKEREAEYGRLTQRGGLLAMGAAEYQAGAAVERGMDEEETELPAQAVKLPLLRGGYDRATVENAFHLLDITWYNLANSEKELDNIAALFGSDAAVYKKGNASEAKLLELNQQNELSRYRYILFSTHGYFCPQEPGLSSVVLSQVHKTADTDGYITAVKWPSYNLKSDLMVLSACETGVGRFVQGEGITGLPFALYVAGNKNTVLTLWNVVDVSTAVFTQRFFQKVKEGKSQVEALNETKRECKNSQYAKPLYWAPFVLYGI